MKFASCAALFALSFASSVALAATDAGSAKKELMNYIKQERTKRWDFEEKSIARVRQFEDQMRKERHQSQLQDETALESSSDIKATQGTLRAKRAERMKEWQKKVIDERRRVAQERKEFFTKLDAERNQFRSAHPAAAALLPAAAPVQKAGQAPAAAKPKK